MAFFLNFVEKEIIKLFIYSSIAFDFMQYHCLTFLLIFAMYLMRAQQLSCFFVFYL